MIAPGPEACGCEARREMCCFERNDGRSVAALSLSVPMFQTLTSTFAENDAFNNRPVYETNWFSTLCGMDEPVRVCPSIWVQMWSGAEPGPRPNCDLAISRMHSGCFASSQ